MSDLPSRSGTSARLLTVSMLGLVTMLSVAGCGASAQTSGDSTSSTTVSSVASAHNNQDIEFAQMMIPHHEQAVVMSEMVPSRTSNQEVIALAAAIKAAQAPEIAQMQSWLSAWGAPASMSTSADDGHGHGGGHGSGGGDGMMSSEQMTSLEKLSGAAFDKEWLEMMVEHHEGAVEMSRQELASGENPQAKALAQAIITSQQAEIEKMQQLLKG